MIAQGVWEPPALVAARRQAVAAAAEAQSTGFREYSGRWMALIEGTPNRSGKMRAAGTVRTYRSKVTGYLVPEFGDTPVRTITVERISEFTAKLDKIPAEVNRKATRNGVTRPVLVVLMMILRQAARDGIIPKAPDVRIRKQESVRHGADHDPGEDVIDPVQVEAVYCATPPQWRVFVLLAAWCQLRRGEVLGLQRRDIRWHDDGTATLYVRRQLNANTGDYTDPKSEAGKRSMSVPRIMRDRLAAHLAENVAREAMSPVVPAKSLSRMPLSNTKFGYVWAEARDSVPGLPPGFRFHDLRHTGLTLFAQEGATLAELMRRGGHSDIKVVLRYQHATMERDRELANRMSERALEQVAAAAKSAVRSA
ncbi:tyrosine-type recombinase/integrase [Xylanimonas allomyrinae]|uniref:tyrosine-type recombinase/integrase n=1 Tax=Xylanimonas allomyrinae TaxID=2509459 RepID=UPI001FE37094|nr:site-specific integrase [Xylanimonas allomyrinae]